MDDSDYSHMDFEDDGEYADSQDSSEQTQQTQSTQQSTQPVFSSQNIDSHLWGYLQPVTPAINRIDFWRSEPKYTIGRNTECNRIILPGFKVSEYRISKLFVFRGPVLNVRLALGNKHCEITWDGEPRGGTVVVLDLSSNGTFVSDHLAPSVRVR